MARGQPIVDCDLLEALNSEHIAGATLDVFHQESLPSDNLFWEHPDILVTPHIASLIDPVAGGECIAENILAFNAGEYLTDIVPLGSEY